MSRMRWNTYDERGETWRRARVRGVAAALALSLAGLGAVTSTADTSRAADSVSGGLDALAQRQAAEEAAVRQAHVLRAAGIEDTHGRRVAQLSAALGADLGALDAAAAQAARERVSDTVRAHEQVDGARHSAKEQLHARAAADKSALDAFFADVLSGLGPETTTPTRTATDAAKRKLETRRSAELSALSSAHAAERDALEARVKAAVAGLDAEAHRLEDEHAALKDALSVALATAERGMEADLAATERQIDAETVSTKGRHAQELLDLQRIHRVQDSAAAGQSGAVRSALDDRQHGEKDRLEAMHANELAAQAYAKKQVQQDQQAALQAAEAQRMADEQAAETAYRAAKALVEQQEAVAASSGSAAQSALATEQDVRLARVKATYDSAVSGVGRGHDGVRASWSDRVVKHAAEEVDAVEALDTVTAVGHKDVDDVQGDRTRAAARRLGHDRDARERRHRQDRRQADAARVKDLGQSARDRDRQLRLVQSEYFTLKVRAVAFQDGATGYAGVGAAYDPATDNGSLYNVARRIGATDLPAGVTGAGVDVALIDTGVVDVPGLAEASVEIGPDFSFEDVVPELRGRDSMGHGTHLAGIIAARDEAWLAGDRTRRPERVLGVAPGARVVSVKAGAADGSVDVTQIIAAVNWVIANKNADGRNIRVLNLSFGTDGVQDHRIDPLTHAVERAWHAGIVVVVAGGNDGWAASRLTNPAQDPYVLAVGSSQALDGREDVPSTYSNGGAVGRGVDLSAPGRSIASLRAVGARSDEANEAGRVGDRLVRGSGTSQAAAVVSGAAALLLQARPELTPDQVKHVLRETAEQADGDDAGLAGSGYLRIDRAVEARVPFVKQTWERSTGTGSLDGARGSVRVVRDGIVLEGQYDVFGRDWSGAKWTEDSWTGAKWTGAKWTGAKWTGTTWSGAKWTSDQWTSDVWDGAKWTSDYWSGAKWTGAKWTSDSFTGAKWTGAKWTSGGWFGVGWDDGPSEGVSSGAEPVSAAATAVAVAPVAP